MIQQMYTNIIKAQTGKDVPEFEGYVWFLGVSAWTP